MDSGELTAALVMLELDGHVEILVGGMYRRVLNCSPLIVINLNAD